MKLTGVERFYFPELDSWAVFLLSIATKCCLMLDISVDSGELEMTIERKIDSFVNVVNYVGGMNHQAL